MSLSKKTSLVTTTINVPTAFEAYLAQFERLGHGRVEIIIIGDKKTPPAIHEWLKKVGSPQTLIYYGVEEQQAWLRRFPELDQLLRWNSIQRRNLGYLIAVERGAELIISVDDDNYVTDDDFLAGHSIVGTERTLAAVSSSTGWFNACDVLQTRPETRIAHRGFPVAERHRPAEITVGQRTGRVLVNAGLWLGEPDVDAVTRLVTPVEVTGVSDQLPLPFALSSDTACPFNSQNTSFDAALLPCWYLVVMGEEYRGVPVSRYDDIWMSYFCKPIIDRLGGMVTYGGPLVRQLRNEHDVLEDLRGELPAMMLSRRLLEALAQIRLTSSTALDCYRELTEALRAAYSRPSFASAEESDFWSRTLKGMEIWADVCREIQPL